MNSHPKVLRLYENGKVFCDLMLQDVWASQTFVLPKALGKELAHKGNQWTATFEIIDVYKGAKWDNTAIIFDGPCH